MTVTNITFTAKATVRFVSNGTGEKEDGEDEEHLHTKIRMKQSQPKK